MQEPKLHDLAYIKEAIHNPDFGDLDIKGEAIRPAIGIDRQAVVDYLNMCLKADPDMMQALCSQGVPVTNLSDANPITCEPGLNNEMVTSGLGLINGLIKYLGEPKPIYACTEGEIGSEVITHFEV
jgi:hypothetical protein